jgi:hypothetical protein
MTYAPLPREDNNPYMQYNCHVQTVFSSCVSFHLAPVKVLTEDHTPRKLLLSHKLGDLQTPTKDKR